MRAAIYARYSSENQRPESIEDQVSACRKLAAERRYEVADEHIYTDMATSGARKDRPGLTALSAASEGGSFDVVLVDDLSRLARDNFLMLSIIAELRFRGVRVISVADGLDSNDEEATIGIQVRGIFNELQLQDLRKKTLRGQIGQKERGFSVGERTFGYKSVPVGEMRMDKKGRPRPDGYRMVIEPREAAIILRIFHEFADGRSQTRIVGRLNEEGVPGRFRADKGWSPGTVSRILRNPKYVGRWTWNKTETRRDPRTGVKRRFPKPESMWIVHEDESLRIVSQELWESVQDRIAQVTKTWPGGNGKGGFREQRGSRVQHYPTHLLSGLMTCDACGAAIAQVSGRHGGYYGCLGATKKACDNRVLVRRKLAERIIIDAVREQLCSTENIEYVLQRVEHEIRELNRDLPEAIRLKQAELESERRRIQNFVEFVAEGRGSRAVGDALAAAELRVDDLRHEIQALQRSQSEAFRAPSSEWIEERVGALQQVLEHRTERSALLLRKLLGKVSLVPANDAGRPHYRARSTLQVLTLLDPPPTDAADQGSNSLRWWSRGDSNP